MKTLDDIRNPKRKSGYDYVRVCTENGYQRPKPFIAAVQGVGWYGPRRATAREAALDFCNYVNGQTLPMPAVLKTAGHEYTIDETDKDPEYQAALGVMRDRRAQRAGKQGYIYLITEKLDGGALRYAKIGYSVNPKKRVAELQTGNPRKLILLYAMKGTEEDERRLHARHIKANVMQEWFRITPEMISEFPVETRVEQGGD